MLYFHHFTPILLLSPLFFDIIYYLCRRYNKNLIRIYYEP